MSDLKMAWRIPTWILVGIGLLLNIVSAVMTNFYIDDSTRQINSQIQQQASNAKLITLIWQQVETVERKKEHILELLANSEYMSKPLIPEIKNQVVKDLSYWLGEDVASLSITELPNLMGKINNVQFEQREKINQLYLDNLELIDSYTSEMEYISQLRSLALFLQVIGLGLVLSRDLNRRDYDKKNHGKFTDK
ncbi:hypothetical protein C9J12_24375 [Photobacterium frigidiphilum]|uniref:DNA mismatch repair protein n=2 Tax=Photobacterium frigidiphilum TaxID=264736 RepID=A0A2T3J8J7_9GAMM|nr:hypothetical protein C9J12_24375 [Photobacterium frigidiphilum]